MMPAIRGMSSLFRIALILAFFMPGSLLSQWVTCTGTGSSTCTTSDVGIGTNSPFAPLQVRAGANRNLAATTMDWLGLTGSIGLDAFNDANNSYIPLAFAGSPIILSGGNVGIGTPSPATVLDIGGGNNFINGTPIYQIVPASTKTVQVWDPSTAALNLVSNANTAGSILGGIMFSRSQGQGDAHYNVAGISSAEVGSGILAGGTLQFYTKPFNNGFTSPRMTISSAGNVGIGTTNPQSLLSVAGTVQAYEVTVNTGRSDYVFDPAYRLAPLTEVADYIKANHHLPEIPSASEVESNGVSVGEMQSKLLAKIEQLTLHMIEANKRIEQLEAQVAAKPSKE